MKPSIPVLLSYFLFVGSGSHVFPAEERFISIGGENSWKPAEYRSGITELNAVRPWPVLALDSAPPPAAVDLSLSFDEASPEQYSGGGLYTVAANPGNGGVSAAGPGWARMGAGAAFFSSQTARPGEPGPAGPLLITASSPEALLAPGSQIRDFSLEFWLYPLNLENGEQILFWTASRLRAPGAYFSQYIRCSVVKNCLQWTFHDLFTAPGGQETLGVTLNGEKPVIPKLWSHHLIRFDADTGLLEYLVNGRVEALTYTTTGGTEGGDVYTPVIGGGGELVLGKTYTGLMDEFRIHRRYAGREGREFSAEGELQKYSPAGGRVETRTFDLGEDAGQVLRLETLGGRITTQGNQVRNEYAGSGNLHFADDSTVQFFMRQGDNPYRFTDDDWQVVRPGTELPPEFQGRYVQVAAVFYPGAGGEASPYLEELRIVYSPGEPPRPPARFYAAARDGAVELNWRQSGEADGYLVYYGTAPGEYFGAGALRGPSPIDTGKRGTLRIEGLDNGTLYYFAVAAYQRSGAGLSGPAAGLRIGELSQEVAARPLIGYTVGWYE
ncbi:MAG: LamG domain-containing protein [Treponema sp.]|nr:LamG domain-containing protein [Treponema sp.]